MILNRSFIEFCILGWDNLPRTLLLYFTNVMISQEGYFHSVICNSNEFKNTTINSDLRYMKWDVPPQMDPRYLNSSDYDDIEMSGAPFARQFRKNDPVLNKIDEKILRRTYGAVPGAWCSGQRSFWADPCSKWRNVNIIRPGPRAEKFEMLMKSYFEEWHLNSSSCNWFRLVQTPFFVSWELKKVMVDSFVLWRELVGRRYRNFSTFLKILRCKMIWWMKSLIRSNVKFAVQKRLVRIIGYL